MTGEDRGGAELRRQGLAVLLVGAVIAAGCSGSGESEPAAQPCPEGSLETPVDPGYGGILFDTHVHLDQPAVAARLGCVAGALEVEAVVLFAHMDPDDTISTEEAYRLAIAGREALFVPFFHVDPEAPSDMAPERLAPVLRDVGLFFRGIGEVGLYQPPWRGTSIADDPWPEVFRFAAERDLFLMLHLVEGEAGPLDRMLSRFPDTKVLLHGTELRDRLPELLREHDDLSFTLDTASLLVEPGAGPLQVTAGGVEVFVESFDEGWRESLAWALDEWLPVVQAAPDRVMWGSDVAVAWQSELAVYARLVAFSRAFIDRLPRPLRFPYAAANARHLLGVPTPPIPDA